MDDPDLSVAIDVGYRRVCCGMALAALQELPRNGETYRVAAANPQASGAFEGYTFNRPPTLLGGSPHGWAGADGGAAAMGRRATKSRPTMGAGFFSPPSAHQ